MVLTNYDDNLIRHGIPEATILIIFGGSGDLTRRKLMPALYHLSRENLLPQKFKIFGLGRRIDQNEAFKLNMKHRVIQYCSHRLEKRYWDPLERSMESIKADYKDINSFKKILDKIEKVEEEWGEKANFLIYLATNPSHFELIITNLANVGMNTPRVGKWNRIIVEKPFGLSQISAEKLNDTASRYYSENQIYRIDHFLGKEAIQNILLFRIYNIVFQPLWNNKYIDHIQILSSETIGVEGRVDFFEQTGAVRDMVQSHLLQILAFLTIDLPSSLDPEIIRDAKVKLFESIRIYKTEEEIERNSVRGQYDQGVVNSELVSQYRKEEGIPSESMIETYAALRLFIDNETWMGVPIYLRTGKRMPHRKTEIYIQLKDTSSNFAISREKPTPNSIILSIQPHAGIELNIGWKPPGILSEIEPMRVNIGGEALLKEPKAYERLLVDAMRGDSTLFIRIDEIMAMWRIVDPFINHWKNMNEEKSIFPNYFAGTQGPKQAKNFIRQDGRNWSRI